MVARILRGKMTIIVLAHDPGRDRKCTHSPCPYCFNFNINKFSFQCIQLIYFEHPDSALKIMAKGREFIPNTHSVTFHPPPAGHRLFGENGAPSGRSRRKRLIALFVIERYPAQALRRLHFDLDVVPLIPA